MGQTLSQLTDCGILHIIVGDPDYEVDDGQIQYSAARRSRERSIAEKKVADSLPAREQRCATLQKKIADNQTEALRCRAILLNKQSSPVMRQQALARADRLLKDSNIAAKQLHREQGLIRSARAVLDRISAAATGATDSEFLENVGALAAHIDVSPKQMEKIEKVGDDLEERHGQFGEYDSALGDIINRLDSANGADDTTEISQTSINEKDVMASLNGLFEQQQFNTSVADPPTYVGAEHYDEVDLKMPSAPNTSLPRKTPPTQVTGIAVTTNGDTRATQTRRTNFSDLN